MQRSRSRRGQADGRSQALRCPSPAAHDAAANTESASMTPFKIRPVAHYQSGQRRFPRRSAVRRGGRDHRRAGAASGTRLRG
jgi:hypothetical protein